jgi:UDP:flavonoid glycosyltransferase YjiC (YdhE family)
MKVVMTCTQGISHFHSMLPLAYALSQAGHEVLFVRPDRSCARTERAGFRCVPVPTGQPEWTPEIKFPRLGELDGEARRRIAFQTLWAPSAQATIGVLRGTFADFEPDLLIHDYLEFGGPIAAEAAGLPYVMSGIGMARIAHEGAAVIYPELEEMRMGLGLLADPGQEWLDRHLYLDPCPDNFQEYPLDVPSRRQPIRPSRINDTSGEPPPPWLGKLPDRPIVHVTLGTVFNKRPGILETIIAGLADEPVNLIVTIGDTRDPEEFGPQPPNVRIERWVAHTLFLPECSLIVSHGGWGTTVMALSYGLPMVTVPLGADQMWNASRYASLGAGVTIDHNTITAHEVNSAVTELLHSSEAKVAAEAIRDEINAMPDPVEVVPIIERLVD